MRNRSPSPNVTARWPWQRSLQTRIVLTYGAVFAAALVLLMARITQVVYEAQLSDAEHNLEIQSFLAANALEDPLSGYAADFEEYARWETELEHEKEKHDEESEGEDDHKESDAETETPPLIGPAPATPPAHLAERLQQVAEVYASDTGARVTILNTQGHAVADSAYPFIQVPNQLAQIEVQTALEGKEQHDIRIDPLTGVLTLYAAAPIQQSNQLLGVVQMSRPMSEVTGEINRLLLSLAGAGFLALVLVTVLGVWLGRRLVQPVRELEQTALAIARGDLNRQASVQSADELGSLARAFNFMVGELRRTFEQQRLFVANASHELRTPLTNIKLRSEALLNGGMEDPAIARRYLAEIDSEADRLGRLANTLLDLSRLENSEAAPPEAPVDLAPVLLSVARSMRLRVREAGQTLRADLPTSLPPLRVWPEQIEAVTVNLLDNAIKYTPAGGEVRLSARVVDHTCEIRVEDTGPGIPEEDLPHIFERFYRVDKSRSRRAALNGQSSGAGLGLAIVQTLVERNGGRIRAESAVGKGTTFIVELPLAE